MGSRTSSLVTPQLPLSARTWDVMARILGGWDKCSTSARIISLTFPRGLANWVDSLTPRGNFLFNIKTAFYLVPIWARTWMRIVCIIAFWEPMTNISTTTRVKYRGRDAGMFAVCICRMMYWKRYIERIQCVCSDWSQNDRAEFLCNW